MRPALQELPVTTRPNAPSRERATPSSTVGRRSRPSPRARLLVLCTVIALLVTAASAAVALAVIPTGVAVTHASSTPTTVVEASHSVLSTLSTTYEGPASCTEPGFLTGDTTGDTNPAAMYRTLCGSR